MISTPVGTEAAAAARKHVVCTKPLTAYVGQDLPADASDADIAGRDRRQMLDVATDDARAMVMAADRAGAHLMYGENWVYAPSAQQPLCQTHRGSVPNAQSRAQTIATTTRSAK